MTRRSTYGPGLNVVCQLQIFVFMLAWIPVVCSAAAQDADLIKPFGLLDFDARLDLRYNLDDRSRSFESDAGSFETRTTWEEELSLSARAFIYHPGFLNMEFTGGPLLVQQDLDFDGGAASNNDTLLNIMARLNFLELKSYPFSIYYGRSHPSFYTSQSGRFLTKRNEYGFSGRKVGLRDSTTLFLDLSHQDTAGGGFGSVIDEDFDRHSFSSITNYGHRNRLEFRFDSISRTSNSGSPGLPIQQSNLEQDIAEIRGFNFFGDEGQFELTQFLRKNQQKIDSATGSDVTFLDYSGVANWRHSEFVRSRVSLRANEVTGDRSNSNTQIVRWDVTRTREDDGQYKLGAEYSAEEQLGFRRHYSGVDGAFSLVFPSAVGRISLGGSLGVRRTDQRADRDVIDVFDETILLEGTTPAALRNDFVVSSSVVVRNATNTQTFIEGFDYRLLVVGSITSIQRLLTGNISDGQAVLVDYRYQTSGTAEFDSLNASASMSVNFLRKVNAYARYYSRNTNVTSGSLSTPVNDLNGFEIGIEGSHSIGSQVTAGWQLRHTDRNEEISPSVSDSLTLDLSTNLPGPIRLVVTSGWHRVDLLDSIEDVDRVSYRLSMSGALWRGIGAVYEAYFFEDTGGSLRQRQLNHRFNLNWAYRDVLFTLNAQLSDETLGGTKRDDSLVKAVISRRFR